MTTLPKIVAFDIDDTLTESKQQLSSEMGELLAKLSQKTIIAVVSGASYEQYENQFLPFLPNTTELTHLYLLPTSGAKCYSYNAAGWRTLYDETLTPGERNKIITELNAALDEVGMAHPTEKIFGDRIQDRESQITFSALGQKAPVDLKKAWDPTQAKRKPLYESLLKRLPEFGFAMNGSTSIDITRKGINKGFGVRKLSELTSIPLDEITYVGDALEAGGNDNSVVGTGVKTHGVINPADTAKYIRSLL